MLTKEFPSKPAYSEMLSRMDDLFLHTATFLSFLFVLLTLLFNTVFLDIISVIIYIVALIVVYGFALYVGYIWGSIKYESIFHRIRGWIYLIEGTVGFSILYSGFLLFPQLSPYIESLQTSWSTAIGILSLIIYFGVFYSPWEKLIIPKISNFMYERVKASPTNNIQELFNDTRRNGKQLPAVLFVFYTFIYTIKRTPTNISYLDWIDLVILPFLIFLLYRKEKTIRNEFHGDIDGTKEERN